MGIRTRTSFQKGQSGNPKGRSPIVAEVRDLARLHTPMAIERLADIAKKGDSDSASVAACRELLDRAWGKAPQAITADVRLSAMTDEQIEARFHEILMAASGVSE